MYGEYVHNGRIIIQLGSEGTYRRRAGYVERDHNESELLATWATLSSWPSLLADVVRSRFVARPSSRHDDERSGLVFVDESREEYDSRSETNYASN